MRAIFPSAQEGRLVEFGDGSGSPNDACLAPSLQQAALSSCSPQSQGTFYLSSETCPSCLKLPLGPCLFAGSRSCSFTTPALGMGFTFTAYLVYGQHGAGPCEKRKDTNRIHGASLPHGNIPHLVGKRGPSFFFLFFPFFFKNHEFI